MNVVLILTTENTPYGKEILLSKASSHLPNYSVAEIMCIHNSYEFTEYVFLLKPSSN